MAEQILNTRIANKYDTLANWSSSSIVLKPGEIAFAYVNVEQKSADGSQFVPTVLMKVGDGVKTFSQLPWSAARAADVYDWAKLENPTVDQLPANLKKAITDLQSAVGDGGSVADAIKGAIDALDSTSTGTGTIVKSVVQTDGKVAVTMGTLSADEIPTLTISKIDGLQGALDAKLAIADFNTFKGTNTTAIEDAKQAGLDAQKDIDDYILANDAAIEDIVDGTTPVAKATNADNLGGVAANSYALKTYADQAEADAVATAATDATSKANKALQDAKDYADSLASNYDAAGAAAAVLGDSADTASDATVYGAIAKAESVKSYADGQFATIANLDKYSLAYDSANKEFYLADENGTKQGTAIDAKPFIKDGMLDNVEYNEDNNTITFTWNTDAGKTEDTIVLNDILDPYVAVDTNTIDMTIDGTNISAAVKDGSITKTHLATALANDIDAKATEADLTLAENRIKVLEDKSTTGSVAKADVATTVAANGVNTAAIADDAVTADKLADDVVTLIQGTTVTNATNAVNAEKATADANGKNIAATYETIEHSNANLATAKTYAEGQATAVIGVSTDASTANTIYGTKKYADEKAAAAQSAAEGHADGLNSTMDTRVKAVEAKPAMGIIAEDIADWKEASTIADTAVQSVVGSEGLTAAKSGTTVTIGFDETTVFVFDCGDASGNSKL